MYACPACGYRVNCADCADRHADACSAALRSVEP